MTAKFLVMAAAIEVAVATLVCGFIVIKLRLSMKREAPHLYESFWKSTSGAPSLRLRMVLPFAKMIYLRQYRTVFADYPRSRAWASWLFAGNWLQLLGMVVLWIAILEK